MKFVLAAFGLIAALAGPASAQPLEQSFAFGAPLSALGNDRFRRPDPAAGRSIAAHHRRGRVAVKMAPRLGERAR